VPQGHPERPDRIRALETLFKEERFHTLSRKTPEACDASWFKLCHPEQHLEALQANIPHSGIAVVDGDTSASPKSWETVLHVNGAAIAAVDEIMAQQVHNAFIAMRPPGHHAEKTTAMGFCFVNTVGIAARYAQQSHGLERVAIVDFDVHHGNGTQDIFQDDPSVLFCSTHQMPLYPGTGAKTETGVGNIINAPLSPNDGGEQFKEAMRDRVFGALEEFRPDMLIISAGFDAHKNDPLASLNFVEEDFDWITGKLMDLADRHCEGRILSVLEGGYDLEGLAGGVDAHVTRLMNA